MAFNPIVLFDACVLYPAPLRDLLMHLAQTPLFRAKWTNDIHEEWIRNLLKNRVDIKREQLERTRDLMNNAIRDCLVTGYESIISGLKLPDANDRHVLAAAIRSNADTILTYNLKDFPENLLKEFNIEAQHPDDFLSSLIDIAAETVCTTIKIRRTSLKNPPKTPDEYLEILKKHSLPQTVSLLHEYRLLI